MQSPWRLVSVLICFGFSLILINAIKSSTSIPIKGVKIACIRLDDVSAEEIDKQLDDYYHIAHTPRDSKSGTLYRCYFRFPTQEIACIPHELADRNQSLSSCTHIVRSQTRSCYFFNQKKYARLVDALKREPAVSKESYRGNVCQTWQEVRDTLINLK